MVKSIRDRSIHILFAAVILSLTSCSGGSGTALVPAPTQEATPIITPSNVPTDKELGAASTQEKMDEDSPDEQERIDGEIPLTADIVSVDVSGDPGRYQFSVSVLSPDSGCEQYADWWEILTEDGQLIYRRILDHSHVTEQPFTRSGSPVNIGVDAYVIIRAHMNPTGYGGQVVGGTVRTGFTVIEIHPDFPPGLEYEPPLPSGCNF